MARYRVVDEQGNAQIPWTTDPAAAQACADDLNRLHTSRKESRQVVDKKGRTTVIEVDVPNGRDFFVESAGFDPAPAPAPAPAAVADAAPAPAPAVVAPAK